MPLLEIETRAHDAHCFVCKQYLHYLKLFCRLNEIDIYQTKLPTEAILVNHTDCRKVLIVNSDLLPSEWMPAAYDLLSLPARIAPPRRESKEPHYGFYLSLNALMAAFLVVETLSM